MNEIKINSPFTDLGILPYEIIEEILGYVYEYDMFYFSLVNTKWHSVISEFNWKTLTLIPPENVLVKYGKYVKNLVNKNYSIDQKSKYKNIITNCNNVTTIDLSPLNTIKIASSIFKFEKLLSLSIINAENSLSSLEIKAFGTLKNLKIIKLTGSKKDIKIIENLPKNSLKKLYIFSLKEEGVDIFCVLKKFQKNLKSLIVQLGTSDEFGFTAAESFINKLDFSSSLDEFRIQRHKESTYSYKEYPKGKILINERFANLNYLELFSGDCESFGYQMTPYTFEFPLYKLKELYLYGMTEKLLLNIYKNCINLHTLYYYEIYIWVNSIEIPKNLNKLGIYGIPKSVNCKKDFNIKDLEIIGPCIPNQVYCSFPLIQNISIFSINRGSNLNNPFPFVCIEVDVIGYDWELFTQLVANCQNLKKIVIKAYSVNINEIFNLNKAKYYYYKLKMKKLEVSQIDEELILLKLKSRNNSIQLDNNMNFVDLGMDSSFQFEHPLELAGNKLYFDIAFNCFKLQEAFPYVSIEFKNDKKLFSV